MRAARPLFIGPLLSAAALLNAHHLAPDDRQSEREELVLPAGSLQLDGVDVDADAAGRRATEIGHGERFRARRLLRHTLLLQRARNDVPGRLELREAL